MSIKDILLISSTCMPYHLDKLSALNGKAALLTFAQCENPYTQIQKAQPLAHDDLEVIFPNKALEDIPVVRKKIKIFLSLISRKEKIIVISLGGTIRSYSPDIFFGMLALRLLGKKVFLTFDTNFLDRKRNVFIELIKVILLYPYMGALCSGPSSADYIKFLGFRRRPVINFGFNTSDLGRYKNTCDNVKKNKNYLLFIGRMSEKKNISFLLDVYSEYAKKLGHKALPLRLAGDGPNKEKYMKKAIDLGLNSVSFLGTLSDKDVAKELSNAKSLLVPSLYEEWGIVVNEAIALSVPVIVSEHVRSREVLIKQFVNGIFLEPDNYYGWVKSLEMLTLDESFYKSLCNSNKEIFKMADVESFSKAMSILTGVSFKN